MSPTPIQSSDKDQFDGKRIGIHGLIAAFGPKEPLIIGVEGEEHIIREPIIVTPSEMTRMHISCARDIPLNRLKLYLRKYPNSRLFAK